MSVIVKGMQMPSSCLECPMFSGAGCKATMTMFNELTNVAVRVKGCPLVELPEKHGYWSETKGIFECSECGYSFEHEGYKHYFNFCPCCGAKMESEE